MADILSLKEELASYGQSHIFQSLPDLAADSKIIHQLTCECRNWKDTLRNYAAASSTNQINQHLVKPLQPENVVNFDSIEISKKTEMWEIGAKAINDGHIGAVIMSGGQGTRLGFDGPKGNFLFT